METRSITIVNTSVNDKEIIMSSATTLGELKADLRENNISYDGMTFYEGISKTELREDASILPHDLNYKGTVTNNLVFMLSPTNKKIKSGAMSRSEIYSDIKKLGLEKECIKRFGQHFTRCKTNDLLSLIAKKAVSNKNTHKNVAEKNVSSVPTGDNIKNAFSLLVNTLADKGTISTLNKEAIIATMEGKVVIPTTVASPYSDAEIAEMFANA